jgi:ParB family chromosome partitioning protein
MANFKKRPVSPDRVTQVERAAAAAPLVAKTSPAAKTFVDEAHEIALHHVEPQQVGSSQDRLGAYKVGMVYEVPLGEIRSNPFNPRAVYTSSAIDDMATSMLSGGQRVSATAYVGPKGEVVLIEGETRLRGARAGGLATLRVEIRPRPASDRALYEEARAANVERRDQTPLDDALKWKELLGKKVYPTQSALAQALELGEDHVSRTLSLAALPLRIVHSVADHPDMLSHKMLNAIREYWEVKGDDDTLELILEVAKHGLGYRDVVARRKAAEQGPVRRTRSLREPISYKGAKGELKSFTEEGRVEFVLKGLGPEASKEISMKILALFSKAQS